MKRQEAVDDAKNSWILGQEREKPKDPKIADQTKA